MNRNNRKLLLSVLVPVLALATVGLAIMQFRWISRAAESERERNLISLLRDGSRAVNQAFDEIRVLATVLRSSSGSSHDTEIRTQSYSALAGWGDQAVFPGLVRGVWFLYPGVEPYYVEPGASDGAASGESGGYGTDDGGTALPEELAPLVKQEGNEPGALDRLISELGTRGYAVVPVRTADDTPGFTVLDVHLGRFFEEVLPYYLEQNISGHTYRIDRARYQENGGDAASRNRAYIRRTGFSLPIPGLSYAVALPDAGDDTGDREAERILSSRFPSDPGSGQEPVPGEIPPPLPEGPPAESPPKGIAERMLFMWEERVRTPFSVGSQTFGGVFVRQLSQTPVIANVILEFSASASNREIGRWIATNTVLSIGVLLLLFTSVLVLLFLYHRTGTQRTREQEFVATMSHELRLPVTVIKAVADNVASGIALKPERLKKYGTELCLEADRLIGMVESILLYSGLQSGNLGTEAVPIHLGELTESVVSGFGSLTERKGITIDVNGKAGTDTVIGDRKGIRTVMENLLMNAIVHAAPTDGPGIVRFSVYRRPLDRLVVSVEDSGPGIPAREQKKIFSPFYRTRASVDGQHPGSGLGLHLVKRIVELNHGAVTVESPYADAAGKLRSGARFTAEFRIGEAAAND